MNAFLQYLRANWGDWVVVLTEHISLVEMAVLPIPLMAHNAVLWKTRSSRQMG